MSNRNELTNDVRDLDPIDDAQLLGAWSQSRAKSALFDAVLEEAATSPPRDDLPGAPVGPMAARRRGLRLAAAAVLVAALAVGLAVTNPLGDDPPAIAGWTPQPQPSEASALQLVDHQCRAMITEGETGETTQLERVLVDQRGAGMVLVYVESTVRGVEELTLCTAVEHPEHGWSGAMTRVDLQADRPPDPVTINGALSKVSQSWQARVGVTAVIGQTTPEVVKVVIDHEEREVEATVNDGLFLAWWPAAPDSTEPFRVQATAYDAQGQTIGSDQWPPQPREP